MLARRFKIAWKIYRESLAVRILAIAKLFAVPALSKTTSPSYAIVVRYLGSGTAFVVRVIDLSVFGMERLNLHSLTS